MFQRTARAGGRGALALRSRAWRSALTIRRIEPGLRHPIGPTQRRRARRPSASPDARSPYRTVCPRYRKSRQILREGRGRWRCGPRFLLTETLAFRLRGVKGMSRDAAVALAETLLDKVGLS